MKTSEANIEDLRNQTVSWGTHRPDDLIPKFMAVLKEYGKEAYDKYVSENPEVEDWKKLDDETKGWVVDELFDLLDGIAPEDCYFGAHPGDGADFGFWQVDESKRKDSKKSESDTADAEQVFTDMADSLGISDRSVITTDGDRVKFVLKLKLKDLEDYAWEYNPKLKVVKNIASPTADAFDGARKTVNTVEDAAAWLKGGIEELLNMEKEAIDLVGNESKKSEADGYKDIFTLDLTRIDAEGDEEGLDDMQAAQNFYDEDEAIQAAKDLADSYKDDDDVVQVTVMAGEQEKPNGDIVGEPFDIFTASSSDSATTAKYREKANYTVTDGLDYYAKGGKSEDFDMNQAFFQAKKAITDWTKRQGHKTLEWLYTDGRKSPTSYPSGIWDFEWDTGNGMATAELKVSPYETRTNSWNDSMDFSLRVGTEDKPTFYTSVEDVLSALDTLISETEESKKSEGLPPKKLGNRMYRSRADLINKMKTLDAVEITTPAQFNDIHSKQWLHTAGYAMDINGNLVGQTYFGDKDGKWYYATTKTFQGDYLPECKDGKKESMERCDSCGAVMTEYEYDRYGGLCKRCRERDESKKSEEMTKPAIMLMFKDTLDTYDAERAIAPYLDDNYRGFSVSRNPINSNGLWIHSYNKDPKQAANILDWIKANTKNLVWGKLTESKKSESLTLKQKELKNMARYGEATDITTISDAEAKELKKKGIETVGISRGAYGMNGALLRDNEGNKYVITAKSSNLFYFV